MLQGWEGDSPFPPEFGLSLPVVGQFYKGSSASAMLTEARTKEFPVFLKAEPYNCYDSNAFKVMCWSNNSKRFVHVGYIQRHAAAKLHGFVEKVLGDEYDVHDDMIVCSLTSVSPDSGDMQFLEVKPRLYGDDELINKVIVAFYDDRVSYSEK